MTRTSHKGRADALEDFIRTLLETNKLTDSLALQALRLLAGIAPLAAAKPAGSPTTPSTHPSSKG